MSDLFSFYFFFLIILIIIYFFVIKKTEISFIILIALILRLVTILFGSLLTLPDGQADAVTYETFAADWAADGFFKVFDYFPTERNSYFISWLIAFPYSLLGRSTLIPLSLNLLPSIGLIILSWNLTKKLWNKDAAKKVAWFVALYPSFILYTGLVLREVYIWFFLLLSVYYIVKWFDTKKLSKIFFSLISFFIVSLFHSPLILGTVFPLLIIFYYYSSRTLLNIKNKKINIKELALIVIVIGVFVNFFSGNVKIKKIGELNSIENISNIIIDRSIKTNKGDTAYPEWSIINEPIEIIYKTPIRAFLFFSMPFPWEIKRYSHIIIMLDSFIYLFLITLILINLRTIWKNPLLRLILIMFIFYSLMFGLGVGNFGTGFRHRAKLIVFILLIVAPFIPNIVISLKRNK